MIPKGLEQDPVWIKYYEMKQKYIELQELEARSLELLELEKVNARE